MIKNIYKNVFIRFYVFTLLHLLVAAYKGVFRTWSNICHGAFFAKIINGFKLLSIFTKKATSKMFDWVENRLLASCQPFEILSSLFFPSLQIKPRKYSAGKLVWHLFWKGKRSRWDSKQSEYLCRSSRLKGSLKKMLWEILQNSQENICAGISFLIKLDSVNRQLY